MCCLRNLSIFLAMFKKILVISLFLLICIGSVVAAQSDIVIHVYDSSDNEPVSGAVVSIFNDMDSTLQFATITDKNGVAELMRKEECNRLIVSCLGYDTYNGVLDKYTDSISLRQNALILNELVVKRSGMTRTAGKFVFDPGSLRSEVNDVFSVLRYTPLINVEDNSVSILGKSKTNIYINGRDPGMNRDAIIAYLKSLPAEQIKRIELITAPGSAERADGADGIVNIVLDNPLEGVLGNVQASAHYSSNYVSPSASGWLAYNKGKFSGFAMLYGSHYGTNSKQEADFYYKDDDEKHVAERNRNKSNTSVVQICLSGKYDFNKRNVAGITINSGTYRAVQDSRSATSTAYRDMDAEYSEMRTKVGEPWCSPTISIKGYYTLTTDSRNSNLDITADYGASTRDRNINYLISEVSVPESTSRSASGYSAKMQYNWNLTSAQKLKIGYEYYRNNINNDFNRAEQQDRFKYREGVHGAFAQWNATWSDMFSMQAGVRMESCRVDGITEDPATSFTRRYTDFFPNLSVNINIPRGNQSVSLDVSRVISRPFYSTLNPFVLWTSPTTCTRGNPYVRPSYGWNINLYYSFLNDFTLSVYLSRGKNKAYDYIFNENGVTVSSTANIGNDLILWPSLNYNKSLGRFRISASARSNYKSFKGGINGTNLSYSNWSLGVSASCRYTISQSHKFFAGISGEVSTPNQSPGRKYEWRRMLGVDVDKSWSNGLSCSFSASNLLGWKNTPSYMTADYGYRYRDLTIPVSFRLSISYTFGKHTIHADSGRGESQLSNRMGN